MRHLTSQDQRVLHAALRQTAMKPLEDFNLGTRIAISVVIVIAIILIIAAIGYWSGRWTLEP